MESVATPLAGAVVVRPGGKDSRWLTLEVCREFARSNCPRSAEECRYAHPLPHVEIQNGRVTCCYDSIKGKCQRTNPPCKYLHPPSHLQEQLLQTGKQNLAMKNLQAQAVAAAAATGIQPVFQVAAAAPGSGAVMLYNEAPKQVLPTYQTMVLPGGQYPYMPNAQQYYMSGISPNGGLSAYQMYNPAAASYHPTQVPQTHHTMLQLVDPMTGATIHYPQAQGMSFGQQGMSLGQQGISFGQQGMSLGQLGQAMASSQLSSLAAANQFGHIEHFQPMWSPLNGYYAAAAAAASQANSVSAANDMKAIATGTPTWSSDGIVTSSSAAGGGSSTGSGGSSGVSVMSGAGAAAYQHSVQVYKELTVGNLAPTSLGVDLPGAGTMYRSSVVYQQAAPRSNEDGSVSVGRKRRLDGTDDVLNAAGAATLVPGIVPTMKRPALVDSKTGLPVYQPLPAGGAASYAQQMGLPAVALQPQARYFTLPVAGLPPF